MDPCRLCQDEARDKTLLCVVEEPKDVFVLERTREYNGRYHVLHGAISPMDGVGPQDLKIAGAPCAAQEGTVQEIILATDPNIEGEATAMYLARLLKPLGVKVTRMAHGMPVGGDLEYVDEVTLDQSAGRPPGALNDYRLSRIVLRRPSHTLQRGPTRANRAPRGVSRRAAGWGCERPWSHT